MSEGAFGFDLGGAPGEIGVVGQLCDRNFVEIGIAEIFRPVGEHPLFDFRIEMNILRRIQRHALEVVAQVLLHLQELHEADAARLGGGAVMTR